MSRLKRPQKKEAADRLVQDITDFSSKLRDLLNNRHSLSREVAAELDKHTKQFPLSGHVSSSKARVLDGLGTELWNASAGLISEAPRDPRPKWTDRVKQGVLVRVFAFLLLDSADYIASRASKTKNEERQIRTLTIAFRATRLCIDKNELQLAMTVLERCMPRIVNDQDADSIFHMANNPNEGLDFESMMKDLTSEFYLLRLLHAWKSSRLDLAEHYHARVVLRGTSQTNNLQVKAADLFYEIARSFAKLDKQDEALKWYGRAFGVSDQVDPEYLSQEGTELRLSIGVSFVDVLLSSHQSSHHKRARDIASKLEQTHGLSNRLAISILKFRVLASEHHADPHQMSQTLLQVVNLAVLTEANFKMIMKTLRKACDESCTSAIHALRVFICTRLLPEIGPHQDDENPTQAWLEKATVAYVLFYTTQPISTRESSLDELQALLDTISSAASSPLSAKATHAAQTLLWKASGHSSTETALAWCLLLRHPLFENAGYINKARIGRKLISVALDASDTTAAREAFFQLPESAKNDSLSRFLAFKIALLSRDDNFAMESLRVILKNAAKDPTLLYACVLESQQSGTNHIILAALQAVLDQRPTGVHMPALLRCTARLTVSLKVDQDHSIDEIAGEATKVFETAAQHIEDLRQLAKTQWTAEIQWWSKNSYNFAVRHCKEMHPEYVVRVLDVCLKFLDCFPQDIERQQQGDVAQRRSLCMFLATTALIVMGRSGDIGSEHTMQCFLHAQEQITKFKSLPAMNGISPSAHEATARAFCMLKFELECISHLQQWDRLNDTLRECLEVRPVERWDTLADLLIIVHEQLDNSSKESNSSMMVQVLQRIINDTWKKQKDITKVARWVRFTFTLCLSHVYGDFSFKLLEQAASMAENGHRGKQEAYPESELQWLATTSFNRAIDILVDDENERDATRWMDGALALAKWSSDNGTLHAIFTEKKKGAEEHARNQAMQT